MDEDTRAIRDELRRVAKAGKITWYSDVAPLTNLDMRLPKDRSSIAVMLDDISRSEHDGGRPLLSAVVIRRDTNIPGRGFFNLVKSLGLPCDDGVQCWIRQLGGFITIGSKLVGDVAQRCRPIWLPSKHWPKIGEPQPPVADLFGFRVAGQIG